MVGTTDVQHEGELNTEAKISRSEFDYLMKAVTTQFPAANISAADIVSTFAGIRPVVSRGGAIAPSKEKREHSISQVPGFITVAGGKLTTFDVIAKEVLGLVHDATNTVAGDYNQAIFAPSPKLQVNNNQGLTKAANEQAIACFGELASAFIQQSASEQLTNIAYTRHLWAELVWAVKYEQVQHLDDLLLRRTRLGNLLFNGAQELLDEVKNLCQQELKWTDQQWQTEVSRYQSIWQQYYSLPEAI
jgi:glycerol-3-phosphate dehydrogenase